MNYIIPQIIPAVGGVITFAHIDVDLYSGTKAALEAMRDCLAPGSIIQLDELCPFSERSGYTEWAQHEWKALCEFDLPWEPLARTDISQAAIQITA